MRKAVTVAGIIAAMVIAATLVSAASQKKVTSPMTVHVIEHATTDIVIDTGARRRQLGRPADVAQQDLRRREQEAGGP